MNTSSRGVYMAMSKITALITTGRVIAVAVACSASFGAYVAGEVAGAASAVPRIEAVEPLAAAVPDMLKRLTTLETPIFRWTQEEPTLVGRVEAMEERAKRVDADLAVRGVWMADTSRQISEALGYLRAISVQVGAERK